MVIRPAIVNPPGPVGGPGTGLKLTQRIIRGPLSLPPRKVSPPTVVLVTPATPVGFIRVYDSNRSVVVVSADDGQKTELPYLPMPVLFAAGSTNLLDQSAVDILQSLGSTLLALYKQDNNVRFVVEGHTSTDREAPDGLNLSTQRASRIHAELVSRYHVPAAILSFKGFGDAYADYRDGTEEQMQLDRRVLVVRTQ
jgi:outer membrane protein OmpA-like peptidoglycan-associated protein